MSILNDAFRPNRETAKEHIKYTIKYYRQMDDGVLERQLKITERGLFVAGFTKEEARQIIEEAKEEMA
ncbi:hypothetical protein [Bacillus toyonensis]|uniref:hypothetical protein n=1 Tax=Bacillus toyonensis TaxID=155322 RepID=UPI00124DDBEA|nr:hypothetical protein [Bacillus toyonensis]KAB2380224.1 hypothetical protein F8507_27465 [Bacillus toyonensis]